MGSVSSLHHSLSLPQILLRLGVESRQFIVGDEAAVLPYVQLVARALLALAEAQSQGFKLRLVERRVQTVEHVFRAALLLTVTCMTKLSRSVRI